MNDITYAFPKLKGVDPSCYIDAYSLVLLCSQAHTPRSFTMKLLEKLKKLCPYDEAIVFFLNENKKITGQYSVGVKEEWVNSYLEYYMDEVPKTNPAFAIQQNLRETDWEKTVNIIDWSQYSGTEFIQNYINGRGLKYSWGFTFFDMNGNYRVTISLDRKTESPFTKREQACFRLALPILNNMYRNFFYSGIDTSSKKKQSQWERYNFTAREAEIANLLCQGTTVKNISSILYIEVSTTYKHMAHIYKKAGVSSKQELLVELLQGRDTWE